MSDPSSTTSPSRILVYGVTGSGKTTMAAAISERTGLPWHEVDALTWEPGWVQVATEEQRRRIEAICEQDRWILDTAYMSWLDVAFARAELVVALDYQRWVSLSRLLRRCYARAIDHHPVCNGNTETFRQLFTNKSIVVWHFRSFTRKRRRIRSWELEASGPPVKRFSSPHEAERWLSNLSSSAAGRS